MAASLVPAEVRNTMDPWSTTGFTGKMSGLPSTVTAKRPTTLSRSSSQHSLVDSTSMSAVS